MPRNDSIAYTLGRLLAALDKLGVVPEPERLYDLACGDPRHLLAPLQRATAASASNQAYLTPLMARLPADADPFGAPLTAEEQSDFALGYYHQRADIRAGVAPTFDDDLTVAQAAAILGITRQTVHQAIEAGRLPARKVGDRATLIRRVDVERYAATRKPRPQRAD